MSITHSQGSRAAVPATALVVGAMVLLIVVIAIIAITYRHLASAPGPTPVVQKASQKQLELMVQMAQKCHGNFNQLSPEDQATVQKMTRGQGVGVIADTAMQNNIH